VIDCAGGTLEGREIAYRAILRSPQTTQQHVRAHAFNALL
jgi:hypothetical protein